MTKFLQFSNVIENDVFVKRSTYLYIQYTYTLTTNTEIKERRSIHVRIKVNGTDPII